MRVMNVFRKNLRFNADGRNVADRRINEQKRSQNRRTRPDRRLNNILVEWIPFGEIALHPAIRESMMNHRSKTRMTLSRKNYQSVLNIFKNKFDRSMDLRKVGDRRIHEEKLPYDRRVRPDRRLNNIVVEWFS
jgi:hypothetical protein